MSTRLKIHSKLTLVPSELPKDHSQVSSLLLEKAKKQNQNSFVRSNFICKSIDQLLIRDSLIEHSSGNILFSVELTLTGLKLAKGQTLEASISGYTASEILRRCLARRSPTVSTAMLPETN